MALWWYGIVIWIMGFVMLFNTTKNEIAAAMYRISGVTLMLIGLGFMFYRIWGF